MESSNSSSDSFYKWASGALLALLITLPPITYFFGRDSATSHVASLKREISSLKESQNLNIPELVSKMSTSAMALEISVEERRALTKSRTRVRTLEATVADYWKTLSVLETENSNYKSRLVKEKKKTAILFEKDALVKVENNKVFELVPNDVFLVPSYMFSNSVHFNKPVGLTLQLGDQVELKGKISMCDIRLLSISDAKDMATLRYSCQK